MSKESINRLNGYRIMWIFCFFDLPTKKKKHKKAYTKFRKDLLREGFRRLQYSVYIRHCVSREVMDVHVKHIKRCLPEEGKVTLMMVTDKQFSQILHFFGQESCPPPKTPQQLGLF